MANVPVKGGVETIFDITVNDGRLDAQEFQS